jgi:hypothetical protein
LEHVVAVGAVDHGEERRLERGHGDQVIIRNIGLQVWVFHETSPGCSWVIIETSRMHGESARDAGVRDRVTVRDL